MEHMIELKPEDFSAIVKQFSTRSGWKHCNDIGSFNPVVHTHKGDNRRKLKYGKIIFVETVDSVE
ncbi:hypothetical protein W70_50 [Escherichia phage W70]|nr:hypothetical protein W70_50 [Escherichia phage W70]